MAVPIISFPQSAFPFKTSTSAKTAAAGLRSSRDATVLKIADTFDTLTASVNIIENLIRSCRVVDEAWFKVIGIGGTGYENAPFLVDRSGVVSLRTPDLVSVGWLGSKFDAAKSVTGAADNGAGLIRLTVAAHGYVSGNTLKVRDVGGVPNATGYWVITWISATQFDLVDSTFAGTFTTGGTAQRYYGGAWFQTLFVGGTSAADAKLTADAAGNLTITNALISLTSGTKSIVLDPSDASITVADTLVDAQGVFAAGSITFNKISASVPSITIGYEPSTPGLLGVTMQNISGTTTFLSYYQTPDGNSWRRSDSQITDFWAVYSNSSAAQLSMARFRGTVDTPAESVTGDYIADINFYAAQGLIITPKLAAQISAYTLLVVPGAGGGVTGTLAFSTNVFGSGTGERLTIYGANIGIDNTMPDARLDVNGTFRVTAESTPAAGLGLEMFYATRSQIRAYNRTTSAWLPIWVDAANLIINHQVATHLVGIGTATPYCKLDVSGTIRAINYAHASAGEGLEAFYASSVGYVQAYDRSGAAFKNVYVNGLLLCLNANAAVGNVLVNTTTDNTDGGVLQITGDVTPSTDAGGSLGTANVQWDDIKFKGDLIQGTTTLVSSTGVATFKYSLTSYANNAAALAGGLAAGDLYTETGTDPLRVCVVY